MRVKISDIVKATGGKLLCGDEGAVVTSFFTDSREAKAGAMFVPIPLCWKALRLPPLPTTRSLWGRSPSSW